MSIEPGQFIGFQPKVRPSISVRNMSSRYSSQ